MPSRACAPAASLPGYSIYRKIIFVRQPITDEAYHEHSFLAANPPLDHVSQPDLRFPHVPVFEPGRIADRLASRSSWQPRGGRRRDGHGRGHLGEPGRTDQPGDSGIWSDSHAEAFLPIARFIKEQGAVPGIQLAHAGRKGSCTLPWLGGGPLAVDEPGWRTLAPSAVPFDEGHPVPEAMSLEVMDQVEEQFRSAARRAHAAGFQVIEVHMAHGYLLHEFLSRWPTGGRTSTGEASKTGSAFLCGWLRRCAGQWPDSLPMLVRISAADWIAGGWDIDQSVLLARRLKEIGADLIDCSSGFVVPREPTPFGPGFQVPFAARIRAEAGIASGAVGFITDPAQAEQILATGQADAVLLARQMLRDPYWPLHAATALHTEASWPNQYLRAR